MSSFQFVCCISSSSSYSFSPFFSSGISALVTYKLLMPHAVHFHGCFHHSVFYACLSSTFITQMSWEINCSCSVPLYHNFYMNSAAVTLNAGLPGVTRPSKPWFLFHSETTFALVMFSSRAVFNLIHLYA